MAAYRPPNQAELIAFAGERGITPIVDKLLDTSTVLLYQDSASFGYYKLTMGDGKGIQATNNATAARSDEPILVLGQLTGTKPFMAVIIQDVSLSARTTAIEALIDSQNRLTATTDGKAGVILTSPSPLNDWKTITLYDANGAVLYSQEGSALQQLRVQNSGSVDIKGLSVLFPGKTADAEAVRVEIGDVAAGETSEYRVVPSGVYRYAAYIYSQNSSQVEQWVTDWVGENPMQGMLFTYRIALDPQKVPGAQIQLIEVLVDQP